MLLRRRTVLCAAAALVASGAEAVAASDATPVPSTPGATHLPPTGWISDARFDADGGIRLLEFSTPPVVVSVPAAGAPSTRLPLLPGGPDDGVEQAVLTPTGASLFYEPAAAPGSGRAPLSVRDVSADGTAVEQVLGTPAHRLQLPVDLFTGRGSIAVIGTVGRRSALLYRPANGASFSTTPIPLHQLGTYQLAFLPDGSALLATLSEYAQPGTFRRIARDGSAGPVLSFGKSTREQLAVDIAVSENGDVDVAELEFVSPNSDLVRLKVAELPAGAPSFGRVRTVAKFPIYGDDSLVLDRDSSGTLTAVASSQGRLLVYRGTALAMRRTASLSAPFAGSLAVVPTDDGRTRILWTAQSTGRSSTRLLRCSMWADGTGWSRPSDLAAARSVLRSEDEGGTDPGVNFQVARALPGGGVGVIYSLSTSRGYEGYLLRLPPGSC